MKKRLFMQTAAALALIGSTSLAQAQATTPIKFQLDWPRVTSRPQAWMWPWMLETARVVQCSAWPRARTTWALPTWPP